MTNSTNKGTYQPFVRNVTLSRVLVGLLTDRNSYAVEEYIVGDLLSSAYPEVCKVSFPEMFKEMFMVPYTMKVNLRRKRNNKAINSVHGKILAFVSDGHRHSVPFRAGSMLFTRTTKETAQHVGDSVASLELARSVVAVPSGWVLLIEVDLCIKIPGSNKKKPLNEDDKLLKATLIFDNETWSRSQTPKGTGIKVEVTITRVEDYLQDFPAQLSPPVEVHFEEIFDHALY